MKKLTFLLSLTAFSSLPMAVEGQTFHKTYGGDAANCVLATIDGNFVVAGRPFFLLKIDPNGVVLWHKSYATIAGNAEASSAEQTSDGGYLVVGTLNYGYPTSKVLLLKADSDGNFQWAKTFGGARCEFGQSITHTFDGNYLIAGHTLSFGTYYFDAYVIKTDSAGNILWSRTFNGGYSDYCYSILLSKDNNFVFCGTIDIPGVANNVSLIKVNQNGTVIWSKAYGGTGDDGGYFVSQTSDGGYVVVGYTDSFGAGQFDAYLIKTDDAGSLKWSKTFGDIYDDELYYAEEMANGDYFLAGYDILSGSRWISGIKVDNNGDTLWTNVYGGSIGQTGYSAVKNSSGYIITGATASFGPNQIYLIKTDSMGKSGCYESNLGITVTTPATIVTTPLVQVSSPPTIVNSLSFTASNASTANTLCFSMAVPEVQASQFMMDDMKLVAIYDILSNKVPAGEIHPSGIYICKYEDNKGNSFFKKIPITH